MLRSSLSTSPAQAPSHAVFQSVPLWRPADNQGHYWPCDLLRAFTMQMATHGKCVSADMMLGDTHYALEQLSLAHSSGDERLRSLAVQLFGFFDAAQAAVSGGDARAGVHH
ncbi:hypothetical protein ACO2Q9_03400 [Variovorax sp. VNK109]|uniref:hypothetical protein n=1 Tax=Variovorax sp. VNK109 TaxID=3400919 RepID=UPI003C11FD06